MYTEYKKHKYCINCDWLQFSVILTDGPATELYCPDGFRLEIMGGNNVFRHRAILSRCSDGAKFLTILWSPYSPKLREDLATCQVANLCLYSSAIHMAYRLLLEIVPCTFNSMGRIDICCDFECGNYEYMRIRELWTGESYVQRKQQGSGFWHKDNSDRGSFCHCLSWGSKTSEIKVKLYNKSREIGVDENSNPTDKPYICEEWKCADMNVQNIWRLEFSLQSSGQLRWNGQSITIDNVSDPNWLWNVFSTLFNKRFECRKRGLGVVGHKNLDESWRLLYIPEATIVLTWQAPKPNSLPSNESIQLLRRMMATLDMAITATSEEVYTSVANVIMRLCGQRVVYSYFVNHYGSEPKQLLEDRFQVIGGGIHESIPSLKDI